MASTPTKSKTEAKYQDHPRGERRCGLCSMFRSPHHCTLVKGKISPRGWCKWFEWEELVA